jgi:hypothetical protein
MAELPGQMSIHDVLADEVEGEPSAARALKVLAAAKDAGWTENPYTSLVLRLTREDARPFFARWDLSFDPATGRKSWRFQGARAGNGQALSYQDIFLYLDDPSVIEADPPDELAEAAGHEDPDQTEASALKALAPLTGPATPAIPMDWSILA